jgi:hypothetical protein
MSLRFSFLTILTLSTRARVGSDSHENRENPIDREHVLPQL